MKKLILSMAGLLLAGSVAAQQYDSLRNFLGSDVQQYVGQVLYLKENVTAHSNNGYKGFAKEPNFDLAANGRNVFRPVQSKDPMQNVSAYDQMAGHYFKVELITTRPVKAFTRGAISHFLELVDLQTGESCFATYQEDTESSFDNFIVVGYYEKLRQLIGQSLVYTGKEPDPKRPSYYLGLQYTDGKGRLTSAKNGTEWTVTDVAIEQTNDRQIIAVLENPMYGQVYTLAADIRNTSAPNAKFQSYEDIRNQLERAQKAEEERIKKNQAKEQEAIDKFGAEYGPLLANGELKEGMTKDMCTWALGSPFNILNSKENGVDIDQWYYTSGRYLYFKGDKLIKFTKIEPFKADKDYYHSYH